MKANKYLPFAFVYFFLNSLALPFGLTYTALLAPFFYAWILLTRKKEIILPFLAILAPFILVQVLYADVVRKIYFYSLLNLLLVYIFCQAFYTFLRFCKDPEKIFRQILIINFIFCLAAIVLYFTPYYGILWMERFLTEGVRDFRRMRLLTYEPSYYATLFTPLFCFFLLQYLFRQNEIRSPLLLIMLFVPYLLSLSFGVMGSLFISAVLTYLIYFTSLVRKRRILNWTLFASVFSGLAFVIVYFFFRNSALLIRLGNVFSGRDLSGRGRTFDSFTIANKILGEHDKYWGIGLGQVKVRGTAIIQDYYLYNMDFVATIPNAVAETFAVFGWAGVALRLFIEIFLFFYTKVWTNYYRLWLFFFIFIYQFTGSFITNVAEYVIWILAFTNVFTEFNTRRKLAADS